MASMAPAAGQAPGLPLADLLPADRVEQALRDEAVAMAELVPCRSSCSIREARTGKNCPRGHHGDPERSRTVAPGACSPDCSIGPCCRGTAAGASLCDAPPAPWTH